MCDLPVCRELLACCASELLGGVHGPKEAGRNTKRSQRNYESYPFQFEGIPLNVNLNPALMAQPGSDIDYQHRILMVHLGTSEYSGYQGLTAAAAAAAAAVHGAVKNRCDCLLCGSSVLSERANRM